LASTAAGSLTISLPRLSLDARGLPSNGLAGLKAAFREIRQHRGHRTGFRNRKRSPEMTPPREARHARDAHPGRRAGPGSASETAAAAGGETPAMVTRLRCGRARCQRSRPIGEMSRMPAAAAVFVRTLYTGSLSYSCNCDFGPQQPCCVLRVILRAALAVNHHRRPLSSCVGGPMRDCLVIRRPGAGKAGPGQGLHRRDRRRGRRMAGNAADIDGIEDERPPAETLDFATGIFPGGASLIIFPDLREGRLRRLSG
jgi:hypothetical protein